MTEINTWCDGTCGLSPEEHEREHPNPYVVLRDQIAEQIGGEAADAALAIIEEHPSLTIRHFAPTQDAYDAACRALNTQQEVIAKVQGLHGKPRTDQYGSGCIQCGIVWPCPTAKVVGIRDPRPDRQGPFPS